ncbi:hypothetical protein [Caulobacter sp. 1776]|uniref:hypothetical protein n=1 Tax=Caulobacter sp. 1776 TaxID=3156420 RepID=UPI00339444DA
MNLIAGFFASALLLLPINDGGGQIGSIARPDGTGLVLQPGRTAESDVVALLGKPSHRIRNPGGGVTVRWTSVEPSLVETYQVFTLVFSRRGKLVSAERSQLSRY